MTDILDSYIADFEKEIAKKDKCIKELEEENENRSQLGLALYTALYEHLGNHGVIDNVPSAIDQLVGKDCGEYANIYNEYKSLKRELQNLESDHNLLIDAKEQQYNDLTKQIKYESEARKRLVKELVLYKKALELACIKITKRELRENKKIIETIMTDYLQQAKEEINDEQKN